MLPLYIGNQKTVDSFRFSQGDMVSLWYTEAVTGHSSHPGSEASVSRGRLEWPGPTHTLNTIVPKAVVRPRLFGFLTSLYL